MNSTEGEGDGMSEQIKVGDLVRVTAVDVRPRLDPGDQRPTAYEAEPLGILADPEWEKVTIEMAFQRVGQLTRERDAALADAEAERDKKGALLRALYPDAMPAHIAAIPDKSERLTAVLGEIAEMRARAVRAEKADRAHDEMTAQRNAACAARDVAVKAHREAVAAAEQVTRRAERDRDAAVRNCAIVQSRLDSELPEAKRQIDAMTEECGRWRARLDEARTEVDHVRARMGELAHERDQEIVRAEAAEAKLAEVTKERDALRAQIADVVEDRAECLRRLAARIVDPSPLTPEQEAKVEAAIGPRQPDGYDPGARPEPEKAADPHAWAKPGVWSVRTIAEPDPVKIDERNGQTRWAFGEGRDLDLSVRRPATPEETARFEAELQRSKVATQQEALKAAWGSCRDVFAGAEKDENGIPEPDSATTRADGFGERFRLARRAAATRITMGDVARELGTTVSFVSDVETGSARLTPTQLAKCAALFGCTPESISEPKPAPIPLAVGQRWVCTVGGKERHEDYDDRIIALGPCEVATRDHDAGGECDTWTHEEFRKRHLRLRNPSELEPAPAPPAPPAPAPSCSDPSPSGNPCTKPKGHEGLHQHGDLSWHRGPA